MATGTGNLPFPGKVYNPFDILTAEELNEDVANIESLATGTGLGDGSVPNSALAGGITGGKLLGGSYSTSEVNTGAKWVDGKDIYKKTIDVGSLPNNTTKSVAHGISDLELVVLFTGRASSGTTLVPLPWVHANPVYMSIFGANLDITSTSNRSTYSGTVDLYYTKT